MEVRRKRKPNPSNTTLSWKTTITMSDLRKVLLEFGTDLRHLGLPVCNEEDVRSVLKGHFFVTLKDYQSKPLIDWCVGVALKAGFLRQTAPDTGRYIVISE